MWREGSNIKWDINDDADESSKHKLLDGGQWCGAVGRAVASDTRRPRFESSHWQLLLNIYILLTICRKDEK